jgi:alkylation response protein AidB-like acyl-CoA dehydrogenase
MDFNLSLEQKILQESARDFLSRECPKGLVREFEETGESYPVDLWRKMADLGWMGLAIPEEYGGSGGSFLDLAILSEAMGYNFCPGPFFSTIVLGCLPILEAGSKEQKKEILPGIAQGKLVMTMALTEPDAGGGAASITAKARPAKGKYVLDGTKLFVPYADYANYILWVGRIGKQTKHAEGIAIFIVEKGTPGITRTKLKTLIRDRQCEVAFKGVRSAKDSILGKPGAGWSIVEDVLEKASVVLCAEMIGGALAVLDMSLQYAKDRTQFNRPIGSFQAIQHHLADMWMDIHGSRFLVYQAAWKISEGMKAGMEVAMAKARVGEAFRRVTILGHQIFGGIGFTKEHDMHLYHKRSITGDLNLGHADIHREKVACYLGL